MMEDLSTIKQDFPAAERISYLNTGTVGIMPGPVQEKLFSCLRWYYDYGPALPEARQRYREDLQWARGVLARFLGVGEDETEFVSDTTAGMNAVIGSLRLRPGDEVIVSDVEHYVGRVLWEYVAKRRGIEVVVARSDSGSVTAADVEPLLTDRTRVISLSHVSFSTGGRLEISAIGEMAREHDIFVLVDGAQSAGALDFCVGDLNCHAFAFAGYKWCLGPEGSGGLYIDRSAFEQLKPPTVALGAVDDIDLDGNYTLKRGARLFAPSTRGYMDTMGLAHSLQYLHDIGMDVVQRRVHQLTDKFCRAAEDMSRVSLVTPRAFERRAGLIAFRLADVDDEQSMRDMAADFLQRGVHLRIVPRPLAFRASFHLYNDEDDVEALLKLIAR